jgi:hypothetical protein
MKLQHAAVARFTYSLNIRPQRTQEKTLGNLKSEQ